jgi:orotate phosphoribosyltransferase-like protein
MDNQANGVHTDEEAISEDAKRITIVTEALADLMVALKEKGMSRADVICGLEIFLDALEEEAEDEDD